MRRQGLRACGIGKRLREIQLEFPNGRTRPEAQSISINRIRADTVVAWRGLVILVYAPIFCLSHL
jgi:hypothetical protein